MSIMSLSTIIRLSVAGFGTREATLVLLFSYYVLPAKRQSHFRLCISLHFFFGAG